MATLTGKVAIVTGGTSGIGERIVERFVEEGAKVVVSARRQEEGRALEKRLGVRFVRADVASETDVKAMVDRAVNDFGRIDCLVANAGVPSPMISIAEIDVATIDQLLAINVRGVLLCIKHVAPVMLAQGTGSIINIGSIAGLRGASGHIYSATKGAVQALTRSVASELGEKGIRVNLHLAGCDRHSDRRQGRGHYRAQCRSRGRCGKGIIRRDATDSAGRHSGRYCAGGGISRRRRFELRQRPRFCDRRRLYHHQRLVESDCGPRRDRKAHQGGGGDVTAATSTLRAPGSAEQTAEIYVPLRRGKSV